MEKKNNNEIMITLNGSNDKETIHHRIAFLSTLLNNAANTMAHIDKLRQRNMNYALLIFAGLFGFSLSFPTKFDSCYIFIAIVLMMTAFTLLDRRLHMLSHGWRESRKIFTERISKLINNPDKDITFPMYAVEGEKKAELLNLQPIIFYLLVGGGILSLIFLP